MKRSTRRAFNLLKQPAASLEEVDTVVSLKQGPNRSQTRVTGALQTLASEKYGWMYRLVVGMLGLAVLAALGLLILLIVTGNTGSLSMLLVLVTILISLLALWLMPTPK